MVHLTVILEYFNIEHAFASDHGGTVYQVFLGIAIIHNDVTKKSHKQGLIPKSA